MARRSSRLKDKGQAATTTLAEPDPESCPGPMRPPRKRAKLSIDDASSETSHHLQAEEDTSSIGDELVETISEDEDFEAPKVKQKRKRGAKPPSTKGKTVKLVAVDKKFKKVRGKLGLLQRLATDMPLDVIFEIFLYLEPLDILRLSRTSLDLRNLLTSRSSEHVWRAARLNVQGLPPPPTDLNEMQYANLAFDNHCHVCGYHPCDNVIWDCRVRCCSTKCIPAVLTEDDVLESRYSEAFETMNPDINTILDSTPFLSIYKGGHPYRGLWYLASVFTKLYNDYQKIKTEGQPALDEWLRNLRSEREMHIQHNRLLENWGKLKRRDRFDQLRDRRTQRKQDVENRLIAQGWGPEVEQLKMRWEFKNHKNLRQAAKVTDGVWAKIGPAFIEMARNERARQQKHRRTQTLRQRHVYLQELYGKFIDAQGILENQTYPPFGDILQSNTFRGVLWDTPLDSELTEDDFADGFAQVPQFIEDWNASKTQELVILARTFVQNATVDDLRLPTNVFLCNSCDAHLWYPKMLKHSCFLAHRRFMQVNQDPDYNPYWDLTQSPWNNNSVVYSPSASETMKAILQACNLTAHPTTLATLDELNPMLECTTCMSEQRGRVFMRWLRALDWHKSYPSHQFSIDSFNDIRQKVLDAEKLPSAMEDAWKYLFLCAECNKAEGSDKKAGPKMSFASLKTHLAAVHGIQEDRIKQENWSWTPETKEIQKVPDCIWLKSEVLILDVPDTGIHTG
ncbi:hypothetical protein VKT23_013187 [Stygiomarasmius scandens]|uniref:F-box domain-containing protein n=1 Tax=Marasmiellus scandens TaxID=2682957 RepID=A0ABR1J761_9AGAR